jgi:hypothetical protein
MTAEIESATCFEENDAVRLTNGIADIVVGRAFGPRVLRYGLVGGPDAFGLVDPKTQRVETPFGRPWHLYGGHRLWYAPEDPVRTYFPDNDDVVIESMPSGLLVRQEPERHTGLEKSIALRLERGSSKVDLEHRLVNLGPSAIDLAPWALTIMAPGGRAIFPHPPYVPHPTALAPARPLVTWPFTKMADPRWRWGDRFITLRHDTGRPDAQKIGLYDTCGWMAYTVGRTLFVKRHHPKPGPHADFGCNVETFTNHLILELESLGPLVTLAPGEAVTHAESWQLFEVEPFADTDEAIEAALDTAALGSTAAPP